MLEKTFSQQGALSPSRCASLVQWDRVGATVLEDVLSTLPTNNMNINRGALRVFVLCCYAPVKRTRRVA